MLVEVYGQYAINRLAVVRAAFLVVISGWGVDVNKFSFCIINGKADT